MNPVFTYFDKSPEGVGPGEKATVDKPLTVPPGAWLRIVTQGHDRGVVPTGRSVITRQFYFRDFTDANLPTSIKSRLVRFQPDGVENHTAEHNHHVDLDLAIDHVTEMATRDDTPLGLELLVTGPAPVYLVAWGFRGVSITGLAADIARAAVTTAFEAALAVLHGEDGQ